jgi:hypothetical protein
LKGLEEQLNEFEEIGKEQKTLWFWLIRDCYNVYVVWCLFFLCFYRWISMRLGEIVENIKVDFNQYIFLEKFF